MANEETIALVADMAETIRNAGKAKEAMAALKTEVYEVGEGFGANANIVQKTMDEQVAAAVKATRAERELNDERQRSKKIMADIVEEAQAIKRAEAERGTVGLMYATTQKIDASAKGVAESVGGMKSGFQSIGMSQLAYALDDFSNTSGSWSQKIAAVSNNLQMVAFSMGIGGAWFLGITGAIQGLKLLTENWGKMSAAFQGLPDPEELKKAAEKLQEQAAKYKASVTAMGAKPDPGMEGVTAKQADSVNAIFAGRQMKQIEKGVLSRVLGGVGGSDLTPAELAELGQMQGELAANEKNTETLLNRLAANPGAAPGASAAIIEKSNRKRDELTAKIQKLELDAATRRADRLLDEAMKPGEAGKKARRELANMAKDAPEGMFPPEFARRLKDIDTLDVDDLNRGGEENARLTNEQLKLDQEVDARSFFPNVRNPEMLQHAPGFKSLTDRIEEMKTGTGGFARHADIQARQLEQAKRRGVAGVRFPAGITPAQARARANDFATQYTQAHPNNDINAQGLPFHNHLLDAVEGMQGVVQGVQRYQSKEAARLEKIRRKTGELTENNRQLSNNQNNRGR